MGKGGSKIPPEELKELVKNTHFEEKELRKWYKGFVKDCPDGRLDKKQFVELYGSFYDSGNANKFAEHVFRTFDVNNDETIGKCWHLSVSFFSVKYSFHHHSYLLD